MTRSRAAKKQLATPPMPPTGKNSRAPERAVCQGAIHHQGGFTALNRRPKEARGNSDPETFCETDQPPNKRPCRGNK